MDLRIPNCAWCSAELPARRVQRGRPRVYCSAACRQAARRERLRCAPLLPSRDDAPGLAWQAPTTSPDEEVVRAYCDARALAASFARLGHEARRPLAFRCQRLAEILESALTDYFPGV